MVDISKYQENQKKIREKAAKALNNWIEEYGIEDRDAMIGAIARIEEWYGSAAGAYAAELYDSIAEMQGVSIPAAEMAEGMEYGEIAKAVNGCMKQSPGGALLEGVTQRLVKQSAENTMLANAKRDGAWFAWITTGSETCPYCRMISAIGWQKAGDKTLNRTNAKHIHANCDCSYVVDFKGNLEVKGYDPDELQAELLEEMGMRDKDVPDRYIFEDVLKESAHNASGNNTEYINKLRRAAYADKKDYINEQKRKAYAKRNEDKNRIRIPQIPASYVKRKVESGEYSLKLSKQQFEKHVNGTKTYATYEKARVAKGGNPQSRLLITYDKAAEIVEKYSGTGIIKVKRDGSPMNIEQITTDIIVGEYWQKGKWIKTNKAALHHGSKGTHIVPIKGSNYD